MKTYVYLHDGAVWEVIPPLVDAAGKEIPVELRYTAEFCESLVDVTGLKPQPAQGWTYSDGEFTAPPPIVPPAE